MIAIKSIPYHTTTHESNVAYDANYPEWVSTTAYAKDAKVRYKSIEYIAAVATTGNPPDISTQWLPQRVCNNTAVFDCSPSTPTKSTTDIVVSITDLDSTATAIAIFGMNGIKYRLVIRETVTTEQQIVFDTGEVEMVETSNLTDWYTYFFQKRDRKKNVVIYGLIPQIQTKATLTVFADPDSGAQVSGMFYGEEKRLGLATWGTKLGIESKSTYNETVFGTEIVKRGSEQYINTTLEIPAIDTPRLMANMKEMKDEVYPYFIPGKEEASLTLGYFKDFNIVLELPTRNLVNLEIKGVL